MSVPRLRFPGFVGQWRTDKLAKLVTKVGSGVTPKGGAEVYQSHGVPLIRSQNVRGDALDLSDVAYISDEINRSMSGSAVQPNDVLLNITGASIGRSCVVPSNFSIGNVNQHVCIIRMVPDADPNFLQTFLASDRGQKLIVQSQSGSGREGLNFENIRAFKIAFPTLPEQKKIAAFLGVVDAKIAALRARVLGLETYKRGLMQALFSQRLRFTKPDGTAFPDWEEKRLGDFLVLLRERVPATTEIPVFSSSRDGLKPQKEYFSDREIDNEGEYGVVPHGYLTYRHMSDDLTFKFNMNQLGYNIAVSKEYPVFRTKGMDIRFLLYWLNESKEFARFAVMQKMGGTRTRLYFKTLAEWEVMLPHPDEQAKIAGALSALDAKIAAVQAQVTKMQAFKKGLLQQMFV